MDKTILDTLASQTTVPLHMPGHKRNTALAPYLADLRADLDITEIHGADCLHHAHGIIKSAMDKASALWGATHSHLLINGSTGGILAGVHATTQPGDGVIMARGCHKSVYNAVTLCQLDVGYLQQTATPEGYLCPVSVQEVSLALAQQPQTKLVVITSPTYEGYHCDVGTIADICHEHGAILMVDQAHGAHLGFCDYFPGSAVQSGADIVIQSLHKTLPSLTQTAIAHVQGDLVDPRRFASSLSIFETSSPSYLLLASIDGCLDLLQREQTALFAQWQTMLANFYAQVADLRCLQVVQANSAVKDPSKIVISTLHANVDGTALKERLRLEHNLELEMAYGDYALAMTGMGDVASSLAQLSHGLHVIDATLPFVDSKKNPLPTVPLPLRHCPAYGVRGRPMTLKPVAESVDCVCASYLWAYPPGVPILVPGEVIGQAHLDLLQTLDAQGVDIQDTLGYWPGTLATVG